MNENKGNFTVIPALMGSFKVDLQSFNSETLVSSPYFSIQSFQKPKILFIISDESNPDESEDQPFFEFMTDNLNYSVTYHEANDSYTYENYDAIVISRSIPSEGTVDALSNASVPILTMEAGSYDEFQLGDSWNSKELEYIRVMNNSHFITEGLSLGTFQIYESETHLSYIRWSNIPQEIEIVDLAQRWLKDTDKTLLTVEKNKRAWDLSLTPERRAFWGGADGTSLTQEAWQIWNKTLQWILYDDVSGNATITVNVTDLSGKMVPNATVNLMASNNATDSRVQTTTEDGSTVFTNVTFGYYNISVQFNDIINDSYTFQEIAGERTFHIEPEVEFTIQIADYIDKTPPIIENIEFKNETTGGTFYADIIDDSAILTVYLNLTAINVSNQAVIIPPTNFTMKILVDPTYINDTALDSLSHTQVQVIYNIIAFDAVGNIQVTSLQSFFLSDTKPPLIREYSVLDYYNGTLEFYAVIIDESSFVVDPVLLMINDTLVDMYVNGSGYWTYRTEAHYESVLNYTIYLAADNFGNENGSKVNPILFPFTLISPGDKIAPIIWDVSNSFNTHEKGYVEFFSNVRDWNNEYQSGLNSSTVEIILCINGINNTFNMVSIEEIRFYFEYTFAYNDTIYYWIRASDYAGNSEPGSRHGPFIIDDNVIPQALYEAKDFGNGTVEFNATVIDWPNNETAIILHFSQNYFGPWTNTSMKNISSTNFLHKEQGFDYKLREVWYYLTATDKANNSYIPTPDQYKKIELTDIVEPTVYFLITNSSINDGEISVTAWAKDAYGDFTDVNNTFYIYFTYQNITEQFLMSYDSYYFHSFTKTFSYLEEVEIVVRTADIAGNMGECRKSIIIEDLIPPKVLQHGILEYQNGTVSFWAEIYENPTGSGLPSDNSSITIEYYFNRKYEHKMTWNGSGNYYTYSVSGFKPENAFSYRISTQDNSGNSYTTELLPVLIIDKTPPIYDSFGWFEVFENHEYSILTFWTEARDSFGSELGVNLTIAIYDASDIITNTFQMKFNGTAYIKSSIHIEYNTLFNYTIIIFDTNANNTITIENTNLRSYWGPVIYSANVDQIDNTLLIWANVSDYGSGIAEVYLEYDYQRENSGLGSAFWSIQVNTKEMHFNGSLYVTELTFDETGTFTWTIIVKSKTGNFNVLYLDAEPYPYIRTIKPMGIEEILLVLTLVGGIPIIFAFIVVSLRKRRQRILRVKLHKEQEIVEHFSDILSIRGLIFRNNAGLPFYT
ncbi:MAG: carboxypeptidase-like regulatory domain-containing protein, partial [Candidatus Hodarchaeota archaeon]